MLTGNGRHRRPRQAPALVVAAGVTGSAIVIPLLAATGASAADATTWDRVAECETDASWSENTGDGYYGGLHLTQWDWENYGGLDFAPSADQASRSQQIAVAEKILDGRGIAAWPTCGPLSALSEESAQVDIDTGIGGVLTPSSGSTDSTDSTDSTGLSGSTGSSTPSPSASPSSSASSDASEDSAKSGNADASATKGGDSDKSIPSADPSDTASGSGRHRGTSADDAAADRADDSSAGRHASRDSATARETPAASYPAVVDERLSVIADAFGLVGQWLDPSAADEETADVEAPVIFPGHGLDNAAEPAQN
ncbi:transglycosylase family protein [Streptomyces sp. NPDC127072]|uniref:transglycosylase family protein n=1 Tax=Streptomyces sp. NPDC127072 TaxID=3347129 RepID=UPI00365973E4